MSTAATCQKRNSGLKRVAGARHLSEADIQSFGAEVKRIGNRAMSDLGEKDERYFRRLLAAHRTAEISGRIIIFAGILHPACFVIGAIILGLAKILDNMEIGHNVLHGQWNWLGDPKIHSSTWEWGGVCPARQWQRSHNMIHHKWTNVIGRDRDFGYEALRVSERQPWKRSHLFQPVTNMMMALFFNWGVAIHDDELADWRAGRRSKASILPKLRALRNKIARSLGKDYLLFPLLAGPYFLQVFLANMGANLIRNLWAYAVIFCGHFADDVEDFEEADIEDEDKAGWYIRQILGSANIECGPWMHLMSGHLSCQIEHHLFPSMPSRRYQDVAPEIRALCERYNIRYNARPFGAQLFSVWRKIFRYALPPKKQYIPS
ncbi:MAG: acyl-CoA desaturase [Alcanivorax sp.]|nr:acyl-CoA desaturase [Alcanivorax sp.]